MLYRLVGWLRARFHRGRELCFVCEEEWGEVEHHDGSGRWFCGACVTDYIGRAIGRRGRRRIGL